MNILVACEESQVVTIELRRLGHNAFSCDILPCSGGHPEWHIQGDALRLLDGDHHAIFWTMDGVGHITPKRWDMIIAFPPCTHLANSGARHFARKRADGSQQRAIEFFCAFLLADCDRIVVENPVGIISGEYVRKHFPRLAETYGLPRKPTQIIQPWQYALTDEEKTEKTTCLWTKGVPLLVPVHTKKPEMAYHEWVTPEGQIKRQTLWYYKTRCLPHEQRATVASKTFPGIGHAIAEQLAGPAEVMA